MICERCGETEGEKTALLGLAPAWLCLPCGRRFIAAVKTMELWATLQILSVQIDGARRQPQYVKPRGIEKSVQTQAIVRLEAIQYAEEWLACGKETPADDL